MVYGVKSASSGGNRLKERVSHPLQVANATHGAVNLGEVVKNRAHHQQDQGGVHRNLGVQSQATKLQVSVPYHIPKIDKAGEAKPPQDYQDRHNQNKIPAQI